MTYFPQRCGNGTSTGVKAFYFPSLVYLVSSQTSPPLWPSSPRTWGSTPSTNSLLLWLAMTYCKTRKPLYNYITTSFLFRYIIFNVPVHANATLTIVNHWFSVSKFLSQVYVYVLYPMSAVSFCASTYMTLAITVERFIAVCRPHHYRSISQVTIILILFTIQNILQ